MALSSPLYPEGASFFSARRLDHRNPVTSLSFATVHLKLYWFLTPEKTLTRSQIWSFVSTSVLIAPFITEPWWPFPLSSPELLQHIQFSWESVWVWKWLMPIWGCIQLEGNRELWCLSEVTYWLCHLVAVESVIYLASWNLSLHICKIVMGRTDSSTLSLTWLPLIPVPQRRGSVSQDVLAKGERSQHAHASISNTFS